MTCMICLTHGRQVAQCNFCNICSGLISPTYIPKYIAVSVSMVTVTQEQVFTACACASFANTVASATPFASLDDLLAHARDVWFTQVCTTLLESNNSLPCNLLVKHAPHPTAPAPDVCDGMA